MRPPNRFPLLLVTLGLMAITMVAAFGSFSDVAAGTKASEALRVLTPNGGERLCTRQNYMITWESPGDVSQVVIELSIDGGANWGVLASSIPSTPGFNQYKWTLPLLAEATVTSYIRITNITQPAQNDHSDGVFEITFCNLGVTSKPSLDGVTLLGNHPNPAADRTEIRWEQNRGANVEVKLYRQNGIAVGSYSAGYREAGERRLEVMVDALPSGIYIYELNVGGTLLRGMMMVVR